MFTGQEHDEQTGLIYFGARFYDPDSARFLNQDTYLGDNTNPPSLHRYLYVYSNPNVFVDPDGHALYAFDGTGNNKFKDKYGSPTNIAKLHDNYAGIAEYEIGIGTGSTDAGDTFGGATGYGGKKRLESIR